MRVFILIIVNIKLQLIIFTHIHSKSDIISCTPSSALWLGTRFMKIEEPACTSKLLSSHLLSVDRTYDASVPRWSASHNGMSSRQMNGFKKDLGSPAKYAMRMQLMQINMIPRSLPTNLKKDKREDDDKDIEKFHEEN